VETLFQDLRFAARGYRKARGATIIAIVCLALGIGANTAIYSVVEGVLLQRLPFDDPTALVQVGETSEGRGPYFFSPANFFDVRAQRGVFADLAAWMPTNRDLAGTDEPERVRGTRATANLFTLLGARPLAGRVFGPSDSLPGPRVVVISEGLWRRRFGADRAIVGSHVTLSGVDHEVIGVMPASFDFPMTPVHNEFWVVLDWSAQGSLTNRLNHTIQAVGRFAAGVDSARASAGLATLARRLEAEFPSQQKAGGFMTVGLRGSIVSNVRTPLLLLTGAVGLVLLIACANVANLLLVRAAGRRREIAIRTAIGAARGRLIRQLLTESVLLSLIGGAFGIIVARVSLSALLALASGILPMADSIAINGSALAFAAAVSFITGLVFGVLPAFGATRGDLRQVLADAAGRSSGSRHRRRTLNLLIIGEIACSVTLLTAAGLAIRSFVALLGVDAGFDPTGVFTFRTNAPAIAGDTLRYARFFGPVLDRVRTLPGVRSAGFTNLLPIQDGTTNTFIEIIGHPKETDPLRRPDAEIRSVSSDYFKTIRTRLITGRELTDTDDGNAPRVMVVNEELVRRFMRDENPLGKQIDPGTGVPATIVGVVASVRQSGLDIPAQPELYLSASQMQRELGAVSYVVSTTGDPLSLIAAVRNAVRQVAPMQPVYQTGPMTAVVANSLRLRRLLLVLLGGFAILAVGLSAAGVYGVISYGVSQRTREIGIRMALGARRGAVSSMVLGDAARVVALGVGVGLSGAIVVARLMASLLYGVSARDPVTFAVAPVIIAVVAILAAAIPALRASRIDPLLAIQPE
jgi:predicted permease